MTRVSVIVLGRGYPDRLINVLEALGAQNYRPVELIVGVLQRQPYNLPQMPFPVTQMTMAANPPLFEAARNAAAMAASGEVLIFLDQRCTPCPNLVGDYARATGRFDGLIMGEVVFRPSHIAEHDWLHGKFDSPTKELSRRGSLPVRELELYESHLLRLPLNFAIRAETFRAVGGFDELEGVKDSDFEKRIHQAGKVIVQIQGGVAYYR